MLIEHRPDGLLAAISLDFPDGHHLGRHFHPQAQFLYAARGLMRLATHHGAWVIPPTRAVWIPPRVEHEIFMSGEVHMRTLFIEQPETPTPLSDCCVLAVTPLLREMILRAIHLESQPRLDGQSRWRLVSQLTLNHLSLVEGPRALEALREILALHNLRDDASARRQIEGLRQLDCQRVVAHVGEDAWRGWRNGLEIRLRLDPQHFVGASGVLFSAVLAQFFSLYATANRFVRTVLVEADKEVKTWQPQAGSPLSL